MIYIIIDKLKEARNKLKEFRKWREWVITMFICPLVLQGEFRKECAANQYKYYFMGREKIGLKYCNKDNCPIINGGVTNDTVRRAYEIKKRVSR